LKSGKISENLNKLLDNLRKLTESMSKNGTQHYKNGAQNNMKSFFLEVTFVGVFSGSLGEFGQKPFALPKICLLLDLRHDFRPARKLCISMPTNVSIILKVIPCS